MGTVVAFPSNEDPGPYRPSMAAKRVLGQIKCNAVISARIPYELKRFLMAEAYVSDARFSEHVARILADHIGEQRLHGLLLAGITREKSERDGQDRRAA